MANTCDSTRNLAAGTANRLRLVQVDFADQSAEVRREYLAEEVERALASVAPEQKKAFLGELMEQFPSWDAKVEVQLRNEETTERTETDRRELADPNFLVARLIEVSAGLGEPERKVLIQRLKEAGLAFASSGAWSEEAETQLRQTLRLTETTVDADRVLEQVGLLSDFALKLDQLCWGSWRRISPKSGIRQDKRLRETLGGHIVGDPDQPRGQVAADLEKLRQLIASLVSAVGQAGRQFASRHMARFSPHEIEAMASMESGGFLKGKDTKCWRKYVELADALTEAAIENEIMETIANYAENLMKGLGR